MTATQSAPTEAAGSSASGAISRRGAEKETPRIRSSDRTETPATAASRTPVERPVAPASAPAPTGPHPARSSAPKTAAAAAKPRLREKNLVVTIYPIVPDGTENLNTSRRARRPLRVVHLTSSQSVVRGSSSAGFRS